jgi:hypothetical protein
MHDKSCEPVLPVVDIDALARSQRDHLLRPAGSINCKDPAEHNAEHMIQRCMYSSTQYPVRTPSLANRYQQSPQLRSGGSSLQ